MAGISTPNLASYYRDTVNRRTTEVTAASWTDGCNDAGSCAPGIGINTGDVNPKPSDWSRDARNTQTSQQIGQTATQIELIQGADVNDQAAFVQATVAAADGAEVIAASGRRNRTGATIAIGDWLWASADVA